MRQLRYSGLLPGLRVYRKTTHIRARCEDCSWCDRSRDKSPERVAALARAHAREAGHSTICYESRETAYEAEALTP